jgi:hypothetical protein
MLLPLHFCVFAGHTVLTAYIPETSAQAVPLQPSLISSPGGDEIHNGPKNVQNHLQDGQATHTQPITTEPCQKNPRRAVFSEELLDWQNWPADGGFEQGSAEVAPSGLPKGNLNHGKTEHSQ